MSHNDNDDNNNNNIICVFSSFSFLPVRVCPTADLDAVVVKEKPASLVEMAVQPFDSVSVIIHTAVSTQTG